jgi:hypothetical protein
MPQTVLFFGSAAGSAAAVSAVALEEMKWRRFMMSWVEIQRPALSRNAETEIRRWKFQPSGTLW